MFQGLLSKRQHPLKDVNVCSKRCASSLNSFQRGNLLSKRQPPFKAVNMCSKRCASSLKESDLLSKRQPPLKAPPRVCPPRAPPPSGPKLRCGRGIPLLPLLSRLSPAASKRIVLVTFAVPLEWASQWKSLWNGSRDMCAPNVVHPLLGAAMLLASMCFLLLLFHLC